MHAGPLRMLAMRFRLKGDTSGSDMWMLASDMAETGHFLAAILIDDAPVVAWLDDAESCDQFVSRWVATLTASPKTRYEFVGAEEKYVSVAGLTNVEVDRHWWGQALRSTLNGESFAAFYPSRSRKFGKFRAFKESYGDRGYPGPGSSPKGGAVWWKHSPPMVLDGDQERINIDDVVDESWR